MSEKKRCQEAERVKIRPPSESMGAVQDTNTSLCTFYEIVAQQNKDAAGQDPSQNQQFYIQFITRYLHGDGTLRTRVTSLTRK